MSPPAERVSPHPPRLRPAGFCAVFAFALALAGCASRGEREGALEAAIQQPLRDLNLMQEEPAQVVRRAAAAPYADPTDCRAARLEQRRLDGALGRDLDESADEAGAIEGLAAGLVREVAGLPFRGIVRRVTGAEKADRDLRRAVVAAVARRGYLRGWTAASGCSASTMPPPHTSYHDVLSAGAFGVDRSF